MTTENHSTLIGRAVATSLLAAGIRHVVLCPGSRSAPLAYAFADLEAAGKVNLHVRIDERAAAFLALGIGKATPHSPAVIITTSGTAVANLLPALWEAHHSAVPLLVISADRPPEDRGTTANQTTPLQYQAFRDVARMTADISPQVSVDHIAQMVAEAVRQSIWGNHAQPWSGPTHLNLCFGTPLEPGDPSASWAAATPIGNHLPTCRTSREATSAAGDLTWAEVATVERTVVVAADSADPKVADGARACGWPIIAEPTANVHGSDVVAVGPAVATALNDLGLVDQVVLSGRPTLSRSVDALVHSANSRLVLWGTAPMTTPRGRFSTLAAPIGQLAHPSSLNAFGHKVIAAGNQAYLAVTTGEDFRTSATSLVPDVARALPQHLMMLAASSVIRDAELWWRADGRPVFANRGLAGIDGTMSTARGIATATERPVVAVVGDLAFLHDLNALLSTVGERGADLSVVVLNDGGGAVFAGLEHGVVAADSPSAQARFERVFGTAQEVDLASFADAYGVEHVVTTPAQAHEELVRRAGQGAQTMRLVEVRCDRAELARLRLRAITTAVRTARQFLV